jgi:hypothetical protein
MCAAAPNLSRIEARQALETLRRQNSRLGRRLCLTLMFETPETQFLCASLFDLAITLETALMTPSEPLLATIRIQWWVDALAVPIKPAATPLVSQLHKIGKIYLGLDKQIVKIIEQWQNASHQENRDSVAGWQMIWQILAQQTGWYDFSEDAALIGAALRLSDHTAAYNKVNVVAARVHALNRHKVNYHHSWLYLQAVLAGWLLGRDTAEEHPMLVWHILKWHYFGPQKTMKVCF